MSDSEQRIVITDLRIPFFRLVMFFVKASLAAIPAAIIVTLILLVISAIFVGLFGAGPDLMMWRRH